MEKKKVVKKNINKKTTVKKPVAKKKQTKKKGFTLIELLAVIIILGILMIIAIPSVTRYINDSRKSAYIDTAKEIISGTRNVVNEGKLGMYDTNTTYYIPASCIQTENGTKSPYGEFTKAYVGVIYNGTGYKYYWISVDDAGQGVRNITPLDKLDTDSIESDLTDSDIESVVESVGIGDRSEIKILNCSNNSNTWDREHHIDNTSNNASEENGGGSNSGSGSGTASEPVCIPATTLHTKTCNRSDDKGCNAEGQAGNGKTITYGTLVNGTPKAGDAYDCKVTTDGDYTERFYYVGSSGSNSILIYYKNITNQSTYAYDSSNENWHGPRDSYSYLPDTSTWNNPGLIAPGTRSIVAENGNGSTSGGDIESFTYTGKAARFLTYQEVASACGSSGMTTVGYLNNCTWLMENLGQYEGSSGAYGYWLETPRSSNTYNVWLMVGGYRSVRNTNAYITASYGVRPVITVKTSDISN